MEEQVLIAGFGGQGVLSLGKILCFAGMKKDYNVSWLPSYGPEVRGGTANCQVIVSDQEIASPMFEASTAMLIFNEPSLHKFEEWARPGSAILLNASLIASPLTRQDVRAYYVPASELAEQAGRLQCLNIVMLGAYVAACHTVDEETVQAVLTETFGAKGEAVLQMNLRALDLGKTYIQTQK